MPTLEPERSRTPFGEVYEAHFDAILGFVTRRTADRHLAADLTADVFVAALEAFEGYDFRRGTHLVWLYGIARNTVASHARNAAREREAVAALSGRRLLDEQDVQRFEERIDAEREARDLLARHAVLSEPLRAVIDLVAVDGLTTKEAAKVLRISQATARVRLHRARAALRAGRTTPSGTFNTPLAEVTR
ncbi:RNA polymerase subunit sigma [Streptomyces colonosanans]|uniref:RNA polymerase subunit sigma n=1 Tax=Streptomyces colonosanans TaxID=1428652 RepID=A0A1S2PIV5_9ACTN|nr:RNA polymerase subunit sigma [Streptomyces colonosanans]